MKGRRFRNWNGKTKQNVSATKFHFLLHRTRSRCLVAGAKAKNPRRPPKKEKQMPTNIVAAEIKKEVSVYIISVIFLMYKYNF